MTGNLHVGNWKSTDLKYIQNLAVGAVITACKDFDLKYNEQDKIDHMILKEADDVDEFDMSIFILDDFLSITQKHNILNKPMNSQIEILNKLMCQFIAWLVHNVQ